MEYGGKVTCPESFTFNSKDNKVENLHGNFVFFTDCVGEGAL